METVIFNKKLAYRAKLCRICFILILISLIYSFFSHTLISQLKMPVLKFPSTDLTYWIFHFLRIPEFISQNMPFALFFDSLLIGSCLMVICYPDSTKWSKIFFILYFIYFIIFSSFGMHHVHSKTGILLLTVPFIISDLEGFFLLWESLRYYTCFIYTSAFCWKILRGSWLYKSQGMLILKKNLTPYLYYNSQSALSKVYFYVIQHPAIPDILLKGGILLEGFFIVGFFTKRFDKFLFLLCILLPLGFLFMADAFFFEVAFLAIVFYKSRAMEPAKSN
jgi:hypothetical protein